jgi:hypothetical protein
MPYLACDSCQRRLYKVGGALRCHFTKAVRCSHYVGPHKECHVKIYYGPEYADSLARAGIKR